MNDKKHAPSIEAPRTELRAKFDDLESPFVFAAEAARYLRLSVRALENFRATGEGPPYRKHGGRVVYHRDDLDLWSARRRYRSSSQRDEG